MIKSQVLKAHVSLTNFRRRLEFRIYWSATLCSRFVVSMYLLSIVHSKFDSILKDFIL